MSDPDDRREMVDEYCSQAHQLVDYVIESAIKKLLNEQKLEQSKTGEGIRFDSDRDTTFFYEPPKLEDFEVQNITWLTIKEFTTEKAEEKIKEFIQTWDYEDSWQCCIDYLGANEFEFDTRYRYRVRWSIPTRRKPIPRATASVYFTFEVSKIKPTNFPVEVHYVFETNRLVHRPGQSRFREKWLKDIIESKVILLEQVDF